ncbi:protein-S-isoprenylcysteine O-methyltransferase Ste14 [Actinoplanes teichomyceticus]|uniref:Protein-S-isoprenylcysteine O-methyltransferase Ste14 n=1 Tax=Actinoplanes teichomyceticus TaxID=1867 RepID=A0A561WMS8_ACTTI|nr:methyltransferase [Actinoplanes teichomyceticus]TWG25181.1 protein-S-isoprenylcysteine O-methyltransferase Ste14 [Actinoplanes teichomyceticus]
MIVARYLALLLPVAAVLAADRLRERGAGRDRNRRAGCGAGRDRDRRAGCGAGRDRDRRAGCSAGRDRDRVTAAPVAGRDRDRAGAFLAFLAAAVGVAALHEVAIRAGWHSFAGVDGAYHGMPVDLWLGWAALWGAVPVLLRRLVPVPVALGLLLWIDMVAMPSLDPLVRLGPHWLHGELLGLAAVALPAQLLGRWTATGRHLAARVLLQMAVFTGLVLWLIPSVAFTLGDGGWEHLLDLSGSARVVAAQAGMAAAVPALAAVREFAVRGGGTPFPWDPPERLVTTGPYAYVANPMQLSTVLLVGLLAAATHSLTLAAVVLGTVAFAAGIAAPHEQADLRERHGAAWLAYRRQVHDWRPRARPYPAEPARLWLDDDCGPCAGTRDMLARRSPVRLRIVPAATHPATLRRARYEAADGYTASGVAAVASAFDHLGLGWAYAGWFLRLPVVNQLAQLITDAQIAPPHPAEGPR